MSYSDFLIEIGTEELPPKALKSLSKAFTKGILDGLKDQRLSHGEHQAFATPRRLALKIAALQTEQAEQSTEKLGPHLSNAYKDGVPTKAAEGFARGCGVSLDELETTSDAKGERLVFRATIAGKSASELLPEIAQKSLSALPIPKRMRWGASRTEFVRPVQWLVIRLGETVVSANLLGCKAGLESKGHRFHSPESFAPSFDGYEAELKQRYVIANYETRRAIIAEQVKAEGEKLGGHAVIGDALLDEVTALVEWPEALSGSFDQEFLKVPAEALISSMREHQKYFHVVDNEGKLLANFITVSNIESTNPAMVISGNERVIRPRLADAKFFFETDCKQSLTGMRDRLKNIVFQAQLGTIYEKTERVSKLAASIAAALGENEEQAARAGTLCKSDLASDMVLEFDDMQGIAGYHYALNDGEHADVAAAMNEQYQPRFAGDALPETATGSILALADRLDTISGIFGIGQIPTGSKDPFALRRACLGVLRLLIEQGRNLDLAELIANAIDGHKALPEKDGLAQRILDYTLERLRAYYADAGIQSEVFKSVEAKGITTPLDFDHRVRAVQLFSELPQALALAEVNKRVSNLLNKDSDATASNINPAFFTEDAESALAEAIEKQKALIEPLIASANYGEALKSLASLRETVDQFFEQVMVMHEDNALRGNRLALLAELRALFLQIADISQLVPAK